MSPQGRGLGRQSLPEKYRCDTKKNGVNTVSTKRNSQLVVKKSEELVTTPYGQHLFDQYR